MRLHIPCLKTGASPVIESSFSVTTWRFCCSTCRPLNAAIPMWAIPMNELAVLRTGMSGRPARLVCMVVSTRLQFVCAGVRIGLTDCLDCQLDCDCLTELSWCLTRTGARFVAAFSAEVTQSCSPSSICISICVHKAYIACCQILTRIVVVYWHKR